LAEHFAKYDILGTAEFADRIKDIGFRYSSVSGMTISISDIHIPDNKVSLVKEGDKLVKKTWVEEANLSRDVYDIIESKYGFRKEVLDIDNVVGVLGVRPLGEEVL